MTRTSLARHPIGLVAAAAFAAFASTHLEVRAQAQPPAQASVVKDGQFRAALGLGASAASGNTQASSLAISGDGVRATAESRTTVHGSLLQSRAGGTATADQMRLGGRHDRSIDADWFGFAGLDLERNRFANLALRSQVSAGVGYHLLATPTHTWDVFGGAAFTADRLVAPSLLAGQIREQYAYPSLLLGEESAHRLREGLSLRQRGVVLPSLKDTGEVRATWTAGLAVALSSAMSLNVGYGLAYNSDPGIGRKSLDTLMTTGIAVNFE
jgi:putative salt-induced outer membrane protein